MKASIPRQ